MPQSGLLIAIVSLLIITLLAVDDDLEAADAKPGFELDAAKEKQLADAAAALETLIEVEKPDYTKAVAQIADARKTANGLAARAANTQPDEVDTPDLPDRSPVVFLEGTSAEEVPALWKQQLALRLRSVREVLVDPNSGKRPHWGEVISLDWRAKRILKNRARPAAQAMREAQVFAMLLSRKPEVIHLKRGDVLFEDDFAKGTDKWLLYGPCVTTQTDKGLRRKNKRVRHADTMIWTKQQFAGNLLFEFTFIANNGGRSPGVLFPICGRPVRKGTDMSVSVGETMNTYNYGIHAYHFSVHRGKTGICNGRKVGTGLHLIASRTPDPCTEVGRAYRIGVGRWENTVFFLVDGKLQQAYYDAGTFGPPLAKGHVGMRHWGGADATYSDVKVCRLVRKTQE
jgi:hypothetical protein